MDTQEKMVIQDVELKQHIARSRPHSEWLKEQVIDPFLFEWCDRSKDHCLESFFHFNTKVRLSKWGKLIGSFVMVVIFSL